MRWPKECPDLETTTGADTVECKEKESFGASQEALKDQGAPIQCGYAIAKNRGQSYH